MPRSARGYRKTEKVSTYTKPTYMSRGSNSRVGRVTTKSPVSSYTKPVYVGRVPTARTGGETKSGAFGPTYEMNIQVHGKRPIVKKYY